MNIPTVNAYRDVHRVEVHQRLVAVIALVGDDLFQRRKNEQKAFIKYPRTFMKFLYRKRFFSSGLASNARESYLIYLLKDEFERAQTRCRCPSIISDVFFTKRDFHQHSLKQANASGERRSLLTECCSSQTSATQLTEIPRGSNTTLVPRTNRKESHDRGKSREEDEREVGLGHCAQGGERRIRDS
jgi:hypothetical protein